jgi:hypothetical protein
MEKSLLLAMNPWWKGKEHIQEDEDYIKWDEKKVKWVPEVASNIRLEPFSLNFIFGPRQVGKTTAIKLIIKELLKEHKPEEIFYFRCDELKDYKELEDLLVSYFKFKEEYEIKSSFIFLDEITFAHEWFRTIKSWIDEGKFKKDVLVVSGSASLEVMKHAEYFPGRRGKGKDFFILPLSFREFLKAIRPELEERLPKLTLIDEMEIKIKSLKIFPHIEELNRLLNLYLRIGGFPLAINSYVNEKEVTSSVREAYLNWIKNDIVKVNRNSNTAREILKSVINKIPSPMSWESIAKETSIKSPKTINAYLHTLQELFLLRISYCLNLNNLTIDFGKNKKIHLIDPLFYELAEEWCLIDIKDKENKKVEDVLASHLSRFGKKTGIFSEEIFYWQNGGEVDSVARMKNKAIGFEMKWGKNAKPASKIVGKMKEIYTISEHEFEPEKKIIPLSIFLSMLGA